ncbi:MAG: leucine-rich repeat domain-containing protein [Simkaniaceae bacterium]|nr:leucine-rich repeat domain-containing protein [Simkaniaceae bacterium]
MINTRNFTTLNNLIDHLESSIDYIPSIVDVQGDESLQPLLDKVYRAVWKRSGKPDYLEFGQHAFFNHYGHTTSHAIRIQALCDVIVKTRYEYSTHEGDGQAIVVQTLKRWIQQIDPMMEVANDPLALQTFPSWHFELQDLLAMFQGESDERLIRQATCGRIHAAYTDIPKAIQNKTNLHVHHRFVTKLPNIWHAPCFTSIENVHIGGNRLKKLPSSFSAMSHINHLSCGLNEWKKLPETISHLKIQYLHVTYCPHCDDDCFDDWKIDAPFFESIQRLFIGSQLTKVPVAIQSMKNLQDLCLSNNKIALLPRWMFPIKIKQLSLDIDTLIMPQFLRNETCNWRNRSNLEEIIDELAVTSLIQDRHGGQHPTFISPSDLKKDCESFLADLPISYRCRTHYSVDMMIKQYAIHPERLERDQQLSGKEEYGYGGMRHWKEFLFLNSTLPLYRLLAPSLENRLIVIKGMVTDDGIGDYAHMRQAQATIRQAFSTWNVMIVAEVEHLSKRKRAFPAQDSNSIFYGITSPRSIEHPAISLEQEYTEQLDAAQKLVADAHFVIDMPHMSFNCLLCPKEDAEKIEEYTACGFIKKNIAPQERRKPHYHMGVGALAYGLLLPSPLKEEEKSLSLLEEPLHTFLMGEKSAETYVETTTLCFGYVIEPFRYILNCFAATKESDKPLDLIVMMKQDNFFAPFIREGISFFKTLNIQTIEYYTRDEEGAIVLRERTDIHETGKTVRIICPGRIKEHRDLRILMAHSLLTGTRGDVSLSEAISEGRLIDYDIEVYKNNFFHSLIQYISSQCNAPIVVKYFNLIYKQQQKLQRREFRHLSLEKKMSLLLQDDEFLTSLTQLGSLVQNPQLKIEMEQVLSMIRETYQFNEVLVDLCHRHILLKQHPELAAQEKQIREAFLKRKISLSQATMTLKTLISIRNSGD